jgi:23S rRNA (adenine2503-C2)-methyltransferase
MRAMLAWPMRDRSRVLIEYVLIPGINDAMSHADELAAYLQPLPCTVNVIPYNPRRDSPWPAPADSDVDRFVNRLISNDVFVKRRRTMGRSIMGACGQLGRSATREAAGADHWRSIVSRSPISSSSCSR